ncbi:hypothetical protein NIES4075_26000 [Tolypothrix sp. NIES-4075]|uniref:hypothetical protein n=1 Tax=Tolypothrix sp. NIES-4075 TaxID=2005459 RepID=UPI000B5C69B8|nr:hypothetical protein [Tolypothrix sp. NIES-4075]GAX41603.1 hypothetical protein NIES4075_26000 [Tolypothrix sp. NIES-4075]
MFAIAKRLVEKRRRVRAASLTGEGEDLSQYGSLKARDAINRRLYKGLIIVKTAIYRVFVIYNFHQKTLSEPY